MSPSVSGVSGGGILALSTIGSGTLSKLKPSFLLLRGFFPSSFQTGLAPGYIDVLGHHLFQDFCREHKVDSVDCLEMRVGALTTTVRPPHFYGFTWSSVGVATE